MLEKFGDQAAPFYLGRLPDVLEVRLSESSIRPVDPLFTFSVDLPTLLGQSTAFFGSQGEGLADAEAKPSEGRIPSTSPRTKGIETHRL